MEKVKDIPESRMRHSFGVANKCYELAMKETGNEEFAKKMYLIGLVHDIGYAFDAKHHAVEGGKVLDSISLNELQFIAEAVKYHCIARKDMSKWERILKTADLSIDSEGNEVTFEERLEDIKRRYGDGEKLARVKRQVEVIRNASQEKN